MEKLNERPPVVGQGIILTEEKRGHVFQIRMKNGHRAYAVLEKKGPSLPDGDLSGATVEVEFSPYDMSRCKISAFREERESLGNGAI